MDNEKALDMLFGEKTDAKNQLSDLKDVLTPEDQPISTHSMNEKTVLDTVKERIEEFKEYNNLTTDPHDELICNTNSDNALPDELSKQDGVPISTSVTDGIHVGDETNNEELISSHNSERAIEDRPITTNTEEISVISTVNSSKFVDESLN